MISTSTSSNIEALRKQRLDLDFEVPEEANSDLIAPSLINDEEFNQTSASSQSVTVCDENVLSETSFLKIARVPTYIFDQLHCFKIAEPAS